jgi:hypothetical protein
MSHIQEILKLFELFWGIAPPDSLKGKKGEDIKSFIRQSHLKYLTNKRKELEGEIHWIDLEENESELQKGYNLAKQEEITKIDKEIKKI